MATTPARALPADPIPTGIPGLDTILGGGLPASDLVFIIGVPGAGKTVLAMQMAFARIARGAKALLLTTFSESHDKLIAHLGRFGFFDSSAIGQQFQFLSILPMLEGGAEETVRTIVRAARQQAIEFVIIDGFRGIRDAFISDFGTRQFLQLLGTQLAYLGTTVVITVEANPDDNLLLVELTTADSIIALRRELLGRQHRRSLEVLKLRGQASLDGYHRYRISQDGVTVYPRLEAVFVEPLAGGGMERAAFGLAELDMMLGGGLVPSTATLLGGSPGTGKTLLALHYLVAGTAAGEAGLLVTLSETETQLVEKGRVFGLDLRGPIEDGSLRILRRAPVELDVDELGEVIRQDLVARPVRRMVFDSLTPLQYALDQDNRTQDYLAALVELLRRREVTSVFIDEFGKLAGPDFDLADTPLFALSNSMLILRQVEYRSRLHRIFSIVKMRVGDYDQTMRMFTIGEHGIQIGEPLPNVEGLLTGVAFSSSQTSTRRRRV